MSLGADQVFPSSLLSEIQIKLSLATRKGESVVGLKYIFPTNLLPLYKSPVSLYLLSDLVNLVIT